MKKRTFGVLVFFLSLSMILMFSGCSDIVGAAKELLGNGDDELGGNDFDIDQLRYIISGKEFDEEIIFSSTVTEIDEPVWVDAVPEEGHLDYDVIVTPGIPEEGHLDYDVIVTPGIPEEGHWDYDVIVTPGEYIPGEYHPPVYETEEYFEKIFDLVNSSLIQIPDPIKNLTVTLVNPAKATRGTIALNYISGRKFQMTVNLNDGNNTLRNIVIKTGNGIADNCTNVAAIDGDIVTLGAGNRLICSAEESLFHEGVESEPGYFDPDIEVVPPEYLWVVDAEAVPPEYLWVVDAEAVPPEYLWVVDAEAVPPEYLWVVDVEGEEGYFLPAGVITTDTTKEILLGYNLLSNQFELGGGMIFAKATITDNEDGTLTVSFVFEDGVADLVDNLYCTACDLSGFEYSEMDRITGFTKDFYYESGEDYYVRIALQF